MSDANVEGIFQKNLARVIKILNNYLVLDIFGLTLLNCKTCNTIRLV